MLKTFLMIGVIMGVLSAISFIIPDSIVAEIDGAIVYFLSAIWNLNGLFDVNILMRCFGILIVFYTSVSLFFMLHWLVKLIR